MLTRPRAIATDVDGTLLRSDQTVSSRTRAALAAARGAGLAVVCVTARPPRWIPALSQELGIQGVVIAGNGAFVVDAATGTVLDSRPFTAETFARVCTSLRARLPGVALAAEALTGCVHEQAYRALSTHHEGVLLPPPLGLESSEGLAVGKILARHPTMADEAFFADVADAVGADATLAYSGATGLAELSPPGVSKATGLREWSQERGISREDVWACGDMPNDIPMLRWAGRGYAVANAHPDVAAVASHRTTSNDDDGVAQVIECALELPARI